MVKEYETSSGEELGTQVTCAALLERVPSELRAFFCCTHVDHAQTTLSPGIQWRTTRYLDARGTTQDAPSGATPTEIDAAYKDQHRGGKGKHAKGNIRENTMGKGKPRGKHESSPKFQGYCGHRGKW